LLFLLLLFLSSVVVVVVVVTLTGIIIIIILGIDLSNTRLQVLLITNVGIQHQKLLRHRVFN
jgi:hypothetical protein